MAYRTTLALRIEMSRLKTKTVYFHGILCRIESTRNMVLSRSLSAMGSRYCPSTVCCLRVRASNPSRPSLSPAKMKSASAQRSEEHTSELQSLAYLVCRLLLEKKKKKKYRPKRANEH